MTVANVSQMFTQGDIATTANPLDMAINGAGFFQLSNNGVLSFSRNGHSRSTRTATSSMPRAPS